MIDETPHQVQGDSKMNCHSALDAVSPGICDDARGYRNKFSMTGTQRDCGSSPQSHENNDGLVGAYCIRPMIKGVSTVQRSPKEIAGQASNDGKNYTSLTIPNYLTSKRKTVRTKCSDCFENVSLKKLHTKKQIT